MTVPLQPSAPDPAAVPPRSELPPALTDAVFLSDDVQRRARHNLASLVSESSTLPSLNAIVDAIRQELDVHDKVAILYLKLRLYGRLEQMFGWQVVDQTLAVVAHSLRGMVGSTLRQLDVVADFTLADNAFLVVLSPPRLADAIADGDLAAVSRRVSERLQAALLNDLSPGIFDRVHPVVGAASVVADDALTFEQNLHRGVALAMQAAEQQAAAYDAELEQTLAQCVTGSDLEILYEPLVDAARRLVVGYHAVARGPFYSPLRLPDVVNHVARRSSLLPAYGMHMRQLAVASAVGLRPDELLLLDCAASEQPNAAVLALSEFYSLNQALVPQHVVFAVEAADLAANSPSALRTLTNVREMGFQLCISRLGAEFTNLELIAAVAPEFVALEPALVGHADVDPTLIDVAQLLVRFADRIGAQLLAPGVVRGEQSVALRRIGATMQSGDYLASADTRLRRPLLESWGSGA